MRLPGAPNCEPGSASNCASKFSAVGSAPPIDAIESSADPDADTKGEAVGTIVVLSDGDSTSGRSNDDAAKAARGGGIPVHTIAFGTSSGTISGPIGQRIEVPVNEAALEKIARQTDGRSLSAATAEQLTQVYEDLGQTVSVEVESIEIGDWFVGAALLLLGLAGLGSLAWFGRLP